MDGIGKRFQVKARKDEKMHVTQRVLQLYDEKDKQNPIESAHIIYSESNNSVIYSILITTTTSPRKCFREVSGFFQFLIMLEENNFKMYHDDYTALKRLSQLILVDRCL